MAQFKDRLRKLRKESGLTQKALAEQFNTYEPTIRTYESGRGMPRSDVAYNSYEKRMREPNILTIVSLAKFFHVSTDYLLGVSDLKTPLEKVVEKPLSEYSTDDLMKEVMRRWM